MTPLRIAYLVVIVWGQVGSSKVIHLDRFKEIGNNLENSTSKNLTLNSTVRDAKAGGWSLFTLVKFANRECMTGTPWKGTCYTKKECWFRKGKAVGTCAKGFGVCCVFEVSCGGCASENCTYFVNPGYPQPFTLPSNSSAQCDLQVRLLRSDICQIRLDFVNFELFGVQEGECQIDMFTAVGTASRLPQLCGSNSGQHVYLDIPMGSDVINLRTSLGYLFDNPDFGRTFKIKVTQLECGSPLLAPPGCLQYFTGRSGTFKSFNYVDPNSLVEGYPINMNYGVCIRKEMGFCSIRYTSSGPFQVGISDGDDTGPLAGDNCMQDAPDGGSRDDFLIIPGGSGLLPSPETADRYCGGDFVPITTSSMPYIVTVVSGDKFDGEVGFMLNYQQLPCMRSG